MEDRANNAIAARPRPTVFAASLILLIAATGLWVGGILALIIAPKAGPLQDTLVSVLCYVPFIVLPIAIYMRRRRGLSEALRLNPMPVLPVLTVILLAIASVFAAITVDAIWTLLLNAIGLREPSSELVMDSSRALMIGIINSAAMPAICEELLFRGLVLSAWEGRGTRLAIWVSSAMFMLLHGNVYGFPAYLLVGAVSAFLVFSLDSLYAGMIYHTVYNATILVLVYLLAGASDATASGGGPEALSLITELAVCLALMAVGLVSVNTRRRLSGIEPAPRSRLPLRPRDRVMLIVVLAVMLLTTLVTMLAGVLA